MKIAEQLFQRAMTMKSTNTKDGDGDGIIDDGKPTERPAQHDDDPSSWMTTVNEAGVEFQTGKPVKFKFMRNTEKAPKTVLGDPYQQKIEPAGRYLLHKSNDGPLPPKWIEGELEFKNPLVIRLNAKEGKIYDENSWKMFLAKRFRATGKALSAKIKNAGYDGIVTVDKYGTSEIVDLTGAK